MAKGDIRLARLFYSIEAESKGLQGDLKSAERSFDRFSKFVIANPVAAIGALAAAAAAAGLKAAEMARAFDTSARKIAATIPNGTARLQDLKKAADQLATSKGLSSEQVFAGLGAIGKEGVTSLEALVARFEALQKAADATGVDITALAGPFDQILDVFGLADTELQKVVATLAAISQENGVGFEELLGAFQTAAPTIREAGLSFDEASAAIGLFLSQGLNAKQTASELKDRFKALGAEGVRALGADLRDTTKDINTLEERARVAAESSDRMSTALQERLAKVSRQAGDSINSQLLDPLRRLALVLSDPTFEGSNLERISAGVLAILTNSAAGLGRVLSGPLPDFTDVKGGASGGPVALPDIVVTAKIKSKEEIEKELTALREQLVRTFTANLPPTIEATAQAIEQLSVKLLATGLPATELAARLDPLLTQLRALGDQAIGDQIAEALSRGPEQAIERLNEVRQSLVDTLGIDQTGAAAQATLQKIADIDDKIAATSLVLVQQNQASADATGEVLDNTEGTADATAKIRAATSLTARQLGDVARGAIGVAQAFGVAGDGAAALLQNVVSIASALPDVIEQFNNLGKLDEKGNALGSLSSALTGGIAILGAFAGIASGLFGEDPEAKRRNEILQKNNEVIADLTAKIGGLGILGDVAASTTGGVASAIKAILDAVSSGAAGPIASQGAGLLIQRTLAGLGLSMEDLRDVAAGLGISFAHATPTAAELQQVLDAIGQADLTQFAQSFTGQLTALQAEFDLFDITDPIEQLKKLRDLVSGKFGSSALGGALAGLDLNDPAQRAQAEKNLQALFTQLQAGTLTLDQLGGLSPDQFLEILKQLEATIDQANSAAGSGGSTTNFTAENRITETTGQRLAGIAETQLAVQRDILAALTGSFVPVLPPSLPAPFTPYTGGLANGVSVGDITVQFMGPVGDPEAAGQQVAAATVAEIDRLMGVALQRRMAQLGRV